MTSKESEEFDSYAVFKVDSPESQLDHVDFQMAVVHDILERLYKLGMQPQQPVQVQYVPGRRHQGEYIHSEWHYTVQLYDRLNFKDYGMWSGTYLAFINMVEALTDGKPKYGTFVRRG